MGVREERIDGAVELGGMLISALMEKGDVTPAQAKVIMESAVRAAVPNYQAWELRKSVERVTADFEGLPNPNLKPKQVPKATAK